MARKKGQITTKRQSNKRTEAEKSEETKKSVSEMFISESKDSLITEEDIKEFEEEKAARLDSLSPLKVLSRGYSLVYKGDKLLSSSEALKKGDKIKIGFGSGGAEAEITDKW